MNLCEASLYVHVPFCAGGKCDYCDFYSLPLMSGSHTGSRVERYIDSVLSEGNELFETYKPENVPTLYIGGGTPSVLGAAGIRRLLGGLLGVISRYSPEPAEITVEANPESADEAFLAAAREAGANRLSLGIQTFFSQSRQAVHRDRPRREMTPDACETMLRRSLSLTAGYFPGSFSADLIAGLPFQNKSTLLNDISALLEYKPAHVSLYALTVEPETPLAKMATAGKIILPDRDKADELWLLGRDTLEERGYNQYEVSNFCLPGREALHNIRYWQMRNWLALGPSASATIIDDDEGMGIRFTKNAAGPSLKPDSIEELDRLILIKETILMGFRYIKGPDEALFARRFRCALSDLLPKTIRAWRERGLFFSDRLALTKEGLLLLDQFLLDAFLELDIS